MSFLTDLFFARQVLVHRFPFERTMQRYKSPATPRTVQVIEFREFRIFTVKVAEIHTIQ